MRTIRERAKTRSKTTENGRAKRAENPLPPSAETPDTRLRDDEELLVHEIATTLLERGRLGEELYRRGLARLGERGMVELVATLGYYCLVSLTLNAFELCLPEAIAPELEDPAFDVR